MSRMVIGPRSFVVLAATLAALSQGPSDGRETNDGLWAYQPIQVPAIPTPDDAAWPGGLALYGEEAGHYPVPPPRLVMGG